MAVAASYCQLSDVLERLYAGKGMVGGVAAPADAERDLLLNDLIAQVSRDFDARLYDSRRWGVFAPTYESRLFSGKGENVLWVDPFVSLAKVEMNATPGQQVATWQDYTSEFGQNRMGVLPLIGYPKQGIFRQSSFYVDPFPLGNVRLTALWGILAPDPNGTIPNQPWEGISDQDFINGLAPGGSVLTEASPYTAGVGWWVTPDDVRRASAEWVVYRFGQTKAGYSQRAGSAGQAGGPAVFPTDAPPSVEAVIQRYKGEEDVPHFALVGSEDQPPRYRWADWISYTP